MRPMLVALIMLPWAILPALGDEEAGPPLAIPKPPGATITMEVNAGREQILAHLQSIVAEFNQPNASMKIDPEKLREALGTLERVQYAEMKISGRYTAKDLIGLFEKEVGGRRVIYDVSGPTGTGLVVLACPQDGGYFGAVIESDNYKEGKANTGSIRAGRLFGFPDVGKAVSLAGPLLPAMAFGVNAL